MLSSDKKKLFALNDVIGLEELEIQSDLNLVKMLERETSMNWGSRGGNYQEYYILRWHRVFWRKLNEVSVEWAASIWKVAK